MDLRTSNIVSPDLLHFLKHCYRYVNEEWPRVKNREPIPDQGFEETFRTGCISKLQGWRISPIREMHLGDDLFTASGIDHEIDLVGLHDQASAIVELKHWESSAPTKNEIIVFFAKILDYVAANPALMLKDVCPIFMSISGFEESGLAACLGLGIHPIGPALRPLPIVVDSAQRIDAEIRLGASVSETLSGQITDLWANVNRLSSSLEATWLSSRCGYMSKNSITVRATSCAEAIELSRDLRVANGECLRLLNEFRTVRTELTP